MKNEINDEKLLRYLDVCKRVYERLKREGTWPWPTDSQDSDKVLESKDSSDDV